MKPLPSVIWQWLILGQREWNREARVGAGKGVCSETRGGTGAEGVLLSLSHPWAGKGDDEVPFGSIPSWAALGEAVSAQGGDGTVKPVVGQLRTGTSHSVSPNVPRRAGKAASSARVSGCPGLNSCLGHEQFCHCCRVKVNCKELPQPGGRSSFQVGSKR